MLENMMLQIHEQHWGTLENLRKTTAGDPKAQKLWLQKLVRT